MVGYPEWDNISISHDRQLSNTRDEVIEKRDESSPPVEDGDRANKEEGEENVK